jgi:beta-glucosidase
MGDEVVQLYTRDVEANVPRPLKELVGFQRINLQPGEKKTVTFTLAVNQLGFYNHNLDFVLEPGTIEVMVGSSSEDIRLVGELEIVGKTTRITDKTFFSTTTIN